MRAIVHDCQISFFSFNLVKRQKKKHPFHNVATDRNPDLDDHNSKIMTTIPSLSKQQDTSPSFSDRKKVSACLDLNDVVEYFCKKVGLLHHFFFSFILNKSSFI